MNKQQAKRLIRARKTIARHRDNFSMHGWMVFDDTKEKAVPERPIVIKKLDDNMRFCIASIIVLQSVGVMRAGGNYAFYSFGRPASGKLWKEEAQQAIGISDLEAKHMFFPAEWHHIDPALHEVDPTADQAVLLINRVLANHGFDPDGNLLPAEDQQA